MDIPLSVSIIMPAYKQAEYIKDAIDSVLSQTYPHWELIIVDDGSPDNVAEIANEYEKLDKRIKFYHTENKGVSAARNFAVSKSSGPFLLPLDADDKINPTYVEKAVRHFIEHPETDLVYCQWEYFGTDEKATPIKYHGYQRLLIENSIFNCAMIRKDTFLKAGGYDENMKTALEDWEFWIRYLTPQSNVYQISERLFFYRQKNSSRNTTSLTNNEANIYIYNKHKDLFLTFIGHPADAYLKINSQEREIKELQKIITSLNKRYYRLWYKKLWYKYIVRKHLEYYD